MYSNGKTEQITDFKSDSRSPQLNDKNQMVWQGHDGNDTEIFLYSDGKITQITHTALHEESPQINNKGQIVWEAYDGHDSEIYHYDGDIITPITNNDIDDSSPKINDNGQIYWITKNWVGNDWQHKNVFMVEPKQPDSSAGKVFGEGMIAVSETKQTSTDS
ncbi:MAG: hypothetical protein GY865_11885 [candidate division Zixibacteria bacterium]|nr:hypothetical protein [candidate division Zixibacteria bacterium]